MQEKTIAGILSLQTLSSLLSLAQVLPEDSVCVTRMLKACTVRLYSFQGWKDELEVTLALLFLFEFREHVIIIR